MQIPTDVVQAVWSSGPLADVKKMSAPGGFGLEITFPNGWMASVINHDGSYGVELAVLTKDGKHVDMTDPMITDSTGVMPWLTADELLTALRTLAARSKRD